MGRRIAFEVYGASGAAKGRARSSYVTVTPYDYDPAGKVAVAIGRQLGLQVLAVHSEGQSSTEAHYGATFGRHLSRRSGGGSSVEASVRFTIPRERRENRGRSASKRRSTSKRRR